MRATTAFHLVLCCTATKLYFASTAKCGVVLACTTPGTLLPCLSCAFNFSLLLLLCTTVFGPLHPLLCLFIWLFSSLFHHHLTTSPLMLLLACCGGLMVVVGVAGCVVAQTPPASSVCVCMHSVALCGGGGGCGSMASMGLPVCVLVCV